MTPAPATHDGDVEIAELRIPVSLDTATADVDDFRAAVELWNAIEREAFGRAADPSQPGEVLPAWANQRWERRRMVLAKLDGRVVGRAALHVPASSPDTGFCSVMVAADARRRGIGTALADGLETLARESGVSKLLSWAAAPVVSDAEVAAGAEVLVPPTGIGRVPADHASVRFALGRGARLEQVERVSSVDLPMPDDELAARLAAARTASGPDYDTVTWIGATPTEWLDEIARLKTRMSTDAPSAGMEEPEDPYTAERVVDEERDQAESGIETIVAAAVHRPSGELAGYTYFDTAPDTSRVVSQEDTIVLREHRGHRLGMLVKLANLEQLQRERPGHPAVITFNAEENRFMLDVNEAVGFAPIAVEGAWRTDL
ncbi:GNAT family N-acetyltransferase [Schumannella soli]|nr:GNAT family N-acetyltransferase [Schumannella soli]